MKLEVGMYAYSKHSRDYGIGKIREINTNGFDEKQVVIVFKHSTHSVHYSTVVGSHNITDLIEENDYIRIITSSYFEPVYYSYGKLVIRDGIDISKYTNKFISEVITHEQMKSMSYKLGDE